MKSLKITILTVFFVSFTFINSCTGKKSNVEDVPLEYPNIVLLMGDDHGWDEVGYNGHPFVKTPVLDKMAEHGMRFDRFYSGHPSCSPTRGSFMTGRHPNRYGTFYPGTSIRPEEITIAQLMKSAGYTTAHFGKWHLGPVKKESPTNPRAMGFDEYLSHDNFFELNPVFSRNGEAPQQYEGESSEILIEEAIQFIQKSVREKNPFMTVIWFGSPHEPYSGLPEDLALYENLPDSLNDIEVGLTSNETGRRVKRPLGDVLQERYAEITAMDRAIGELRDYLEENNLKENTLFFYCGDNGTPPSAGRTGLTVREDKGHIYEGGILVPGVIEWPAVIKEHVVNSNIASTSDLFPTLAEITNQALPDRPIDGISLLPYLKDPDKERTEPIFFWMFQSRSDQSAGPYIDPKLQEGTTPLAKMLGGKYTRNFGNIKYTSVSEADYVGDRAMLTNKYKFILDGDTPNDKGYELYNIQMDPGETKNIADQYPDVAEEMNTEIRKWQESVLNSLTAADYK